MHHTTFDKKKSPKQVDGRQTYGVLTRQNMKYRMNYKVRTFNLFCQNI